jgi:hypothetical protein
MRAYPCLALSGLQQSLIRLGPDLTDGSLQIFGHGPLHILITYLYPRGSYPTESIIIVVSVEILRGEVCLPLFAVISSTLPHNV